jgi:hypothetical protein
MNQIKSVIKEELADREISVILFGSRATGKDRIASDVDIALKAKTPIDRQLLLRIKDRLEDSTIPYRVDLVDWSRVSESVQNDIDTKGRIWTL